MKYVPPYHPNHAVGNDLRGMRLYTLRSESRKISDPRIRYSAPCE